MPHLKSNGWEQRPLSPALSRGDAADTIAANFESAILADETLRGKEDS
jgi:hypothetical protein